MDRIKFLVFADFHYKRKMYSSTVAQLERIIQRAKDEHCDMILHEGDFCNDYHGSAEAVDGLLNSGMEVYGVYGNHELETVPNDMRFVTPKLTNRPAEVVWGTESGTIENGEVGYYYLDRGKFRLIFLDSCYSLKPDGATYEHNRPASWGEPDENSLANSLGRAQLSWLEHVLTDAAEQGVHCIVNAHVSFSGAWGVSPDGEAVRRLIAQANARRSGTVLMCLNGHYHTNRIMQMNQVTYFDVNAALNGWWQAARFDPYQDERYTFDYVEYDHGQAVSGQKMKLSDLSMGAQTLFFAEPLSATVTVYEDGRIDIDGARTTWAYGVTPPTCADGVEPAISSYRNG